MSVGPLGFIGSIAGTPLSQAKGAETERTQEATNQQRQVRTDDKAEQAAGIGQTDQDSEASDRDADGRRLWEAPAKQDETDESEPTERQAPRTKDVHGQAGNHLDLLG